MLSYIVSFLTNIIITMLQLIRSNGHMIKNLFCIYIKTTNGKTMAIDIDPKSDIKQVKEMVALKMGTQPEELKIIFAGRELDDNVIIEECDLGQQSILHVVKRKAVRNGLDKKHHYNKMASLLEDDTRRISESSNEINENHGNELLPLPESNLRKSENKIHFYVYCPTCKDLKQGKLRVRCHFCKSGAFTVHSDPQNWNNVLKSKQITGTCENDPHLCADILQNREPTFAEFYFKCSEHISLGENDEAAPLDLIGPNYEQYPCFSCFDVTATIIKFPCDKDHTFCLDCFKTYCLSKLVERQFWQHPEYGYTISCPNDCPNSFIKEIHHFRLLDDINYERYHRFATEEFVLQSGGVLCPQPNCGMGMLVDRDCIRITCQQCKYVFCRNCLQGSHLGECDSIENRSNDNDTDCSNNNSNNTRSDMEEASRKIIKVVTKPCPNCKTPTERDGGCMHMVCTRAGCKFHWCWVCQTGWARECMGDHWFG